MNKQGEKQMNSKKSRTWRLLPALALILALILGSFSAASADVSTGTDKDHPAAAAITKVLQMPEGTPTPAYTFTFNIVEGKKDGNEAVTSPEIDDKTLEFAGSDDGATNDKIKTVKKQTANILAGVSYNSTGTGIYNYTITENATVTGYSSDNGIHEIFVSKAVYAVKVYVAKDTDGTLFVKYVEARLTKTDNNGDGGGVKVDPTPGVEADGSDFSDLAFTNKYVRNNIVDPPPTDNTQKGALYIDESVTGDLADSAYPFSVNVTVTLPAITISTPEIKAYLVDSAGSVSNPQDSGGTAYNASGYYTLTSGDGMAIVIKPGQRLVFGTLPVGTAYAATQTGVANYTANVSIEYNGADVGTTNASEAGQGISTEASALSSVKKLVAVNASGASFTNANSSVAPTGIIINNLPYILLVVLALAALAAYVVTRSRRRREYTDAERV
jgi:hypothetical protein